MNALHGARDHILFMGLIFINSFVIYPPLKKKLKSMTLNKAEVTHYAFFDIEIEGREEGRIVFELFGKEAPKTVNNFLGLCIAGHDKNVSYWNHRFHKIAYDYIAQAGDIMYQDGTGSDSVYEGDTFDMENNNLKFKEPYLIAAAKRADGKIGSQFFITLDDLPYLNGQYCIFGRVNSNTELVDRINECGSEEGKPSKSVIIKRSGLFKPKKQRKETAVDLKDFNTFVSSKTNISP